MISDSVNAPLMKQNDFLSKDMIYELGPTKALVLDKIFSILSPHNNKAKLNVIGLSKVLPISDRTAQRSVKELTSEKFLIKHSRSEYELSPKFFDTFPEYKNRFVI